MGTLDPYMDLRSWAESKPGLANFWPITLSCPKGRLELHSPEILHLPRQAQMGTGHGWWRPTGHGAMRQVCTWMGRAPLPGKSQSLTVRAPKIDLSGLSFYLGQNRPRAGESLVPRYAAAESQPPGFSHPSRPEGQHPGLGTAHPASRRALHSLPQQLLSM